MANYYVTNTQMKTIAKKIGSVTSSLDKRVSLLEEMAKDDLYTSSTDSTTALVKAIPTKALSVFYLNNLGGCVTKTDDGLSYNYPQSVEMYGKSWFSLDGEATASSTSGTTYSVSIPAGTYKFTNFSIDSNTKYYNVYVKYSTGTVKLIANFNTTSTTTKTVELEYDVVSLSIYYGNTNHTIRFSICRSDVTDVSYTDYKEPTTLQSAEMWSKIAERVGDLSLGYLDEATGKWVQEYGLVDLGTLSWSYNSTDDLFYASLTDAPNYIDSGSSTAKCDVYDTFVGKKSNITDKSIRVCGYSYVIKEVLVKDSSYTDASAFKTAMSGKYLYYPLVSNIETDISDILEDCGVEVNSTYGQVCREAEGGGTIVITTNTGLSVPSEETFLIKTV